MFNLGIETIPSGVLVPVIHCQKRVIRSTSYWFIQTDTPQYPHRLYSRTDLDNFFKHSPVGDNFIANRDVFYETIALPAKDEMPRSEAGGSSNKQVELSKIPLLVFSHVSEVGDMRVVML